MRVTGRRSESEPTSAVAVDEGSAGLWARIPNAAAFLACLTPLVVSVSRSLRDHYVPASDWGLIELDVRAVGTRVTPLIGAWSRFGWRHPGPLPVYLLAIPYRLLGSSAVGLQIGAVLINATAMAMSLLILRRRGRAVALLGALGLLLLQLGMPANFLRNEWNASLAVFPFVLLVVAAWDAESGRVLSVATVPLAATFVMQAHLGYVAVGLPPVGLWMLAVRKHRADARVLRVALLSSGAALVAWLPPIVDAVGHAGGNLSDIARWSINPHGGTAGIGNALRLVGDATSLGLPFVRGQNAPTGVVSRSMGPVPLLLLVLLGFVFARSRRRDPDLTRLVALLSATWVAAALSMEHISGPIFAHLVWALMPLAMLSWFAVALYAGRVVARAAPRLRQVGVIATVVALSGAAVTLAPRIEGSRPTYADSSATITTFTNAARNELGNRKRVVIDRVGAYLDEGALQIGVIARLAEHGITARVPERSRLDTETDSPSEPNRVEFPASRVEKSEADAVVLLVAGRESLLDPPGRMLARVDPLDATDQKQWLADYASARAALVGAHQSRRIPDLESDAASVRVRGETPDLRASLDRLHRLSSVGLGAYLWVVSGPDI